ncbi:MAG: hypothetical protein LQ351_003732 [Letrouitia transgressa]|nr:MAG: hypothetical protein LQ351_003732 [Letrouitia transgressa]
MTNPKESPLIRLFAGRNTLAIAWHKHGVSLYEGFDSRFVDEDKPWTHLAAFDMSSLAEEEIFYMPTSEGRFGSKRSFNNSQAPRSEHMSQMLAHYHAFLEHNVTSNFDKFVKTNPRQHMISQHFAYRPGTLFMRRTPPFTEFARCTLQHQNGDELFRAAFGDYFVAGLILGGVTGTFMTAASPEPEVTSEQIESGLTFTYHCRRWSNEALDTCAAHGMHYQFTGYDSINDKHDGSAVTGRLNIRGMTAMKDTFVANGIHLAARVYGKLQEQGISEGTPYLRHKHCQRIAKSGIVVELLMMPYTLLNEYRAIRQQLGRAPIDPVDDLSSNGASSV